MEILRAETTEFHHLKNDDGPTSSSPASSTVDDDEDQFSSVSTADDKLPSIRITNTSPSISNNNAKTEIKTENEDRSTGEDDNENEYHASSSPVTTAAAATTAAAVVLPSASVQSLASSRLPPTIDYARHRERLVKELKDYEDRWMAHRNFLLYTQSFAMKPEDRERLFAQLNGGVSSNNMNLTDDHSQQHQLQLQQQLFHRLSKDERDRFTAAAFYHHQQQQPQQQQQQQQQPPPPPNPILSPHLYNFHPYPWSQTTSSVVASTPTASPVVVPQPAPPPSASSDHHQPPKSPSSDDSGNQSNSGSTTEWTFEEQFRQLYELSDEPKRKEFLDDLFSFMQKRGTPVNRIPIMAKHVLDLYELFRLVVGKGGLVEVINKKLWREVTKGLNLPSSITSAAFTLRTQYMKYLYPYECEKLQLSSPGELQAAIEGNRREGRRPSYAFEYSSPPQIMPPPPPPSNGAFLASPLAHRPLDPTTHGHEAMQHAAMAAAAALSHPFFLASAAASTRDVTHSSLEPPPRTITPRLTSFDDHQHHHHHPAFHHTSSSSSSSPTSATIKNIERSSTTKRSLSPYSSSKQRSDDNISPAPKKLATTMNNNNNNNSDKMVGSSIRSTNSITTSTATTTSAFSSLSPISKLKITAKENNPEQQQSIDKSITISIELNGVAYQGTLYASTFTGKE